MNRRDVIKKAGLIFAPSILPDLFFQTKNISLKATDFGQDFLWGVATASFQNEGAVAEDGKSPSIWDTFSHTKGKIKTGENADISCDFYHNYREDLALLKSLNFNTFRFSLAWTRILPDGTGTVNQKGLDFYHRVIDTCLELGIEPYITLYHWDLPQVLQDKGGWTNRDIIQWFSEYVDVCSKAYGDKVKNWMVFNEPFSFTGLGYFTGYHAPGKKGVNSFLSAVHHTALCQAAGGRIIRKNVPNAHIGTTFSCSYMYSPKSSKKNDRSVARMDALYNRLFIEPALGMGYPTDAFSALSRIEKKFVKGDDMKQLAFDFDFIGLQNYFQIPVKHSLFPPILWAKEIRREWEAEGMYKILKQFSAYKSVKKIIITENGFHLEGKSFEEQMTDTERIKQFKSFLSQILKAKNEGINIKGYLVWTWTDNFEWAEGYSSQMGLVHVDRITQKRTVKGAGHWFKGFLNKNN
jgi:beta-glucosidase